MSAVSPLRRLAGSRVRIHTSGAAPLQAVLLCATLLAAHGCASKPQETGTSAEALAPVGAGFNLNASDLRFIRQQIRIAEAHAAGGTLLGTGPNQVPHPTLPYGLRTVDGRLNNLQPGQSEFGAADRLFPRVLPPDFRPAEAGTSYAQTSGLVVDSRPRIVSNLIVDQTVGNPAAIVAAGSGAVPDASGTLFIPNVAPDVGLSAPYNSVFTLFGQFFDHGLDLVTKGGGTVFVPLQRDDPLFDERRQTNFMVLTRATIDPGSDGVLGTADDRHEGTNTTTPFVDQNQTYTSHPSHQVFLRQYRLEGGRPVATGKLIDGAIPRNIGNWSEVKAQAASMLGIALADVDVLNVPLLATDPYGRFLRGPNGLPQVVFSTGLVEGNLSAPVSVVGSVKTGHAFLDDIAHHAAPVGDHDNNPATPPQPLAPDSDPGFTDDGDPATYDDELLGRHFVTGDGRGNENIGLTFVHTIFHSEHNRLADDIHGLIPTLLTPSEIADWTSVAPGPQGWDYGEKLFQAARFVTEMEYQHLVFEEFARKVQPQVNLFAGYHTEIDPAIVAEFAHAVYRFGHSMLTETVARTNADGSNNDIPLLAAFLNPLAFNDGGAAGTLTADLAAGSIARGMSRQVGNEIDEFITEALRNRLLGLPLDLATINLARARSEGVPTLNAARRGFFAATGNSALMPYESWADFSLGLRHQESVVNFIAAYGTHPSVTGTLAARRAAANALVFGDPNAVPPTAPPDSLDFMLGTGAWLDPSGRTITGVDDVDFWVGGLAEKQAPFGGLLGSSFNHIFETQLEKLQDGDRFYYLARTAGLNLLVQLEGNSFAELIMRNTDVASLPADVFSRPDFLFHLANLGASGPILDDPSTAWDERALLIRMPNGTIRFSGPEHVVWDGTDDPALVDRIWSSEGDDTLRGNGGRDIMEGGAGNDNLVGGEGDDVLTDSFGDDVLKGGDGNDYLSSGPGFDLNQGGRGSDFIVGGSDPTETFGGPGNDFIFAGDSTDTVFGDDGDDWIEGGGQADLLQGDNGAPFQNDPNQPGHDVIIGDGGDDDYDAEGGDDIMVSGPGIERNEGMLGFDWVTHRGDPQPANADMNFTGLLPPDVENVRDRFDLVEGLSGWRFDDVLRGDSRLDVAMVGHELDAAGIARIAGLQALLGPAATSFTGGNIILGGAGSDLIEGRGGNDIIDGDAWLNVQLRAPDPASPGTFKLVDSMLALRADVAAGRINPGDISIVRSIVNTGVQPTDVDTAAYSGPRAQYTLTLNADGSVTVDHNGGIDGVDTLRNIELLRFADQTIPAAFPVAGVSAAALTFPLQVVGTPSAPQAIALSNTGAGPLAIGGIVLGGANPADFALANGCGATLAVGASCSIGVTFAPTAPGARTAALVITSNAANSPQITVALSGSATSLSVVPAALAFSSALTIASAPQVVTVSNAGSAAVRINGVTRTGANPGQFAHTTTCGPFPRILAPGASCTVSATFTPTTDGAKSAQLNVNTAAPEPSRSVALTGTVVAGTIAVAPSGLAFSSPLNITSATQVVTVTNTDPSIPVRITGVARAGTNPGQFAHTTTCGPFPANLAGGVSCTVTVTFTPTTAGAKSALLTVSVAAPGASQSVALAGTVVAPTFTVAPASLAFGSQPRNTTSAVQAVTVANTSPAATLRITGVTRTGANPGQFAHTSSCLLPADLPPGASCTVSVTFTPTGAGARSASLNVNVAAPGTSQSVPLSGTGL